MSRVPPTLVNYQIPADVLTATQSLLAEPGRLGLEAAALWLGRLQDESTARVLRAVRPTQTTYRTEHGVGVALDQEALTRLICSMANDEFVFARLHTHPTDAYHSHTDDMNYVVGHEGAISIVVPGFAGSPIDLTDCSVNELRRGRWAPLSQGDVAARFRIEHGEVPR